MFWIQNGKGNAVPRMKILDYDVPMRGKLRVANSIILALCWGGFGIALGQSPIITNVTNAAFPYLDTPPHEIRLAPRSLATIFGSNLSDREVSIDPPWQQSLGGTEVHYVISSLDGSPCVRTCEVTLDLLYVSPVQINFLVPDLPGVSEEEGRVVFIRDGIRYDARYDLSPPGPGIIIVTRGNADSSIVFDVGFDCLYSFSTDPGTTCGFSRVDGGVNTAALGAITDISGTLITSTNPVHQGEVITIWVTDLPGLTPSSSTGSYAVANPAPIGFGLSQKGEDVMATIGNGPLGQYVGTLMSSAPLFAGESPQFVGLDQINVAFPTCPSQTKASSATRFDAWLAFTNPIIGNELRLYIPLLVRPGDSDCTWPTIVPRTIPTTTTINSVLEPDGEVTLSASVTPSLAAGTVDFADGDCAKGCILIGSAKLVNGEASVSGLLLPGPHSISALYEGDDPYQSSSSIQTAWTGTSISLSSDSNPAKYGQPITFTATISPSDAAGEVDFMVGSLPILCNGGVSVAKAGTATCKSPGLASGTFQLQAIYRGESTERYAGSETTMSQVVQPPN